MQRQILALLIVAVIVVIALVAVPTRRRYHSALGGMWAGDPGFLREASLGDFQLYIADDAGGASGTTSAGYIIMTDPAGGFISNTPVVLRVTSGLGPLKFIGAHFDDRSITLRAEVRADDGGAESNSSSLPFPPELKLVLTPARGQLELRDDEKVYGVLRKDFAATDAARAAASPGDTTGVQVVP